jgi:hypothetical protein
MPTPFDTTFVLADAFGLTRVSWKKGKASVRSTLRFSARRVSVDVSAKRVLAVGHHRKGVYEQAGTALLRLPGLGVATSLDALGQSVALVPGVDEAVVHDGTALVRWTLSDPPVEVGSIPLAAPLGEPPMDVPETWQASWVRQIATGSGGTFLAINEGGSLVGGHLDRGATWRVELGTHAPSEVRLGVDGNGADEKGWIALHDARIDRAHVLVFEPDGYVEFFEFDKALGPPAFHAGHVLVQHSSEQAVLWHDGKQHPFDLRDANAPPHEAPESGFLVHGSAPEPTRRAGEVHFAGGRALFVPWHHETLVELEGGAVHDRALPAEVGPLRRGLREMVVRENQALAPLGLRFDIEVLHMVPKRQACPVWFGLSPAPPTLLTEVVGSTVGSPLTRYHLETHGWRSGSMRYARAGALVWSSTATLNEVRALLSWLRHAERSPLEIGAIDNAYGQAFGIPSGGRGLPFAPDAERVWLSALVAACSHEDGFEVRLSEIEEVPAGAAAAAEAAPKLARWRRPLDQFAVHQFAFCLVSCLGEEALAPLLALTALPEGVHRNACREAGELVLWHCHHHPSDRAEARARIAALAHSEAPMLLDALDAGKRHLWSSG